MESPWTKLRGGAAVQLLLAALGAVLPLASLLWAPRRDAERSAWMFSISITCAALLPGLWRNLRQPDWQPALWPEDSPRIALAKRLSIGTRLAGLLGFAGALVFSTASHRHAGDVPRTIGYFALIWAPMIDRYRERRTIPKPSAPPISLANPAPIHSDQWGRSTV